MNKFGYLALILLTLLYLSNWYVYQPRTPKQEPQQVCVDIYKVIRTDTNEFGKFVYTTENKNHQQLFVIDTVDCKQYYIVRL